MSISDIINHIKLDINNRTFFIKPILKFGIQLVYISSPTREVDTNLLLGQATIPGQRNKNKNQTQKCRSFYGS